MRRLAIVTVVLSGCALVPEEQPWSFVASVGGMAVDTPVRGTNGLTLPVRANVSGLEKITLAPTTLNSGLVCAHTRARIDGRTIYLRIATALTHEDSTPRCPSANLGNLPAGTYQVVYGSTSNDAFPLGKIRVEL